MPSLRGRGLDKQLDGAVRRFFEVLQSSRAPQMLSLADLGLQTRVSAQMWQLLRPVIDEHMEASLREGVAIYGKLLEQFGVDRQRMPITSAALVRRCLNRRPNFLDPPSDLPYAHTVDTAEASAEDDLERRVPMLDAALLSRAQLFMRHSHEIYGGDAVSAGLNLRDVVVDRMADDRTHLPRHAIFVDHVARAVVVAIRGTASLRDAIMALVTEPAEAFGGRGQSHKGILAAVMELVPEIMDPLCKAVTEYPDYRMVATGHSLGAGTALLLTLALRGERGKWEAGLPPGALDDMECFAFAPPPLWAPRDSLSAADTRHMYSFCHNTDMIPRSSLRALQILGALYIYVGDTELEEAKRMAAILAPEGDTIVDEVCDQVDAVLRAIDEDMATGKLSFPRGDGVELLPRMYVPGRIFHLYPTDESWRKSWWPRSAAAQGEEGDGDAWEEYSSAEAQQAVADDLEHVRQQRSMSMSGDVQHGGEGASESPSLTSQAEAPDPIARYRIQEISADLLANAPLIESDFFAMDHTTAAYLTAFQRLEVPKAL